MSASALQANLAHLVSANATESQYATALKAVKAECRSSPDAVAHTHAFVMTQLAKERGGGSDARLRAFMLADILFRRSDQFRQLMSRDFERVLELTLGINNHRLPPPAESAQRLRQTAFRVFGEWEKEYAHAYRHLQVGMEFLRTHRETISSIAEMGNAERARADLLRRQKAARLARFTTVSTSVASDLPDILDALHRMDAAFSLVIPDVADGFLAPTSAAASSSSAPISADADDASLDSLAKQLGLGSSAYRLSIEVAGGSDMFRSIENADNSAVFDTLRESALLLQKSMLPRVRGWLAALRDSESVDAGEHERLVKRLVDVQGHVQDAMQRCDVLAVNQQFYVDPSRAVFEEVPEEDEEEEAGEEEGESAGTESSVVEKESETAETASKSTENASKSFEIASTSTSTSTSEVAISPSVPSPPRTVREELLASAPVIPFAADLAHWDATMRDIESATIGHETMYENPWFRFKDEVSLPQELLDARFKRAVQWKPAEREYPPCRARLPGGISLRLCDRRDAHVCPFHGPIVPRDDNGDVIEEEEELSQNQGQSQPQTEASVPGEVREVEFDGHVTEAEAESAGRRLRPAREVTAAEAAAAAARLVGEADAAKKKKGKGKKRKEEDAFRRVLGGSMSKRARAAMDAIDYRNREDRLFMR